MDGGNGQGSCQHSGFYSGLSLYSQDAHEIRYVLICDECGEEIKQIASEPYSPDPMFEAA
jgi:hypothetical protein